MQDTFARATLVYKIPYRRARAWPSVAPREQRFLAYKRYALGDTVTCIQVWHSGCFVQPLGRVRARAKVSYIQPPSEQKMISSWPDPTRTLIFLD